MSLQKNKSRISLKDKIGKYIQNPKGIQLNRQVSNFTSFALAIGLMASIMMIPQTSHLILYNIETEGNATSSLLMGIPAILVIVLSHHLTQVARTSRHYCLKQYIALDGSLKGIKLRLSQS